MTASSGITGLELRLREVDSEISMPVILVSDNLVLPSLDPEVGDILQTYVASSLSSSKSSFLLLAPNEDASEDILGEALAAGKSQRGLMLTKKRTHQCTIWKGEGRGGREIDICLLAPFLFQFSECPC